MEIAEGHYNNSFQKTLSWLHLRYDWERKRETELSA